MSLATASIRARLIRSEIATSVGSTSIATKPALRMVSSWRCDELATRIAISLLASTRTTSHSMGPSARMSTPDRSQPRAASHASDKNGKGAVALDTTLGVTAYGLDRSVLQTRPNDDGIQARVGQMRTRSPSAEPRGQPSRSSIFEI